MRTDACGRDVNLADIDPVKVVSLGIWVFPDRWRLYIQTTIKPALSERRQTFPDEFPEGLKPRLRLFLSVDLVGSTPYKQSRQVWRPEILSFYSNFDHIFRTQYQTFNESGKHNVPAPEFWKSNGDELLYVCELQGLSHAHAVMHVWVAALEEYRRVHHDISDQLDIKSTAWIGLFPVPNCEVFFLRGGAQQAASDPMLAQSELRDAWYADPTTPTITRDFVGPSIDTGFRLTSWSTPNRMVVSVDLAFLLTGAYSRGVGPLKLHVSGKEKLRGVIDDQPYPTIWIPVGGHGEPQVIDPRQGMVSTDRQTIRSYCEAIIEQNYKSITPLHLAGARYDDFDWVPPYILNRILKHWDEEVRYRTEVTKVVLLG